MEGPRLPLGWRLSCEAGGALEHEGVDECLGKVAAQLALRDVELLGEQAGRAACGAVAFEPPYGLQLIALLVLGERGEGSAEQEGAFGFAEGTLVVAEAVRVVLLGEFCQVSVEGEH